MINRDPRFCMPDDNINYGKSMYNILWHAAPDAELGVGMGRQFAYWSSNAHTSIDRLGYQIKLQLLSNLSSSKCKTKDPILEL